MFQLLIGLEGIMHFLNYQNNSYGKKNVVPDIMAGITVGIVCISNV